MRAAEAWQAVKDSKEAAKEGARQGQLERDERTVCDTLMKFPKGESKTVIRDTSGLNSKRFNPAFAAKLADGTIVPWGVQKGNHKTPHPGYKLAVEAPQ